MRILQGLFMLSATAAVLTACGDDVDNDDPGSGGTGNVGNTGGSGNTGNAGGTGGTGGSGNTGNTGGVAGGGGGTGGAPACDLSGAGKAKQDIPSSISGTTKLTSDKVWTIKGEVRVVDGGVLEIEPCTRVEGDGPSKGALFINRGGKIMAQGTKDAPILFTSQLPAGSRGPGNWGGISLLGKAPNVSGELSIEGVTNKDAPENKHGGNVPNDSSGVMTFVRIEFSGSEVAAGDELNGLTFGSVGSGTVIENIMVNSTYDDCFEWFGGTVSAKNLVCNNGGDDMFDTDDGWKGTITNAFGRHVNPNSEDPNGHEWDGTSDKANPTIDTESTMINVTMCGLGKPYAGGSMYGMVLRRGIKGMLDNNVVLGFDASIDVRDNFGTLASPGVSVQNSFFALPLVSATDDDSKESPAFDEAAWFTGGTNNKTDGFGFTLDDCLAANGPTTAVTGSGKGAFKESADWMTGLWISWDTK